MTEPQADFRHPYGREASDLSDVIESRPDLIYCPVCGVSFSLRDLWNRAGFVEGIIQHSCGAAVHVSVEGKPTLMPDGWLDNAKGTV